MKRRLLLLLAHPDDETFGPGGTIARYAREGVDVHLATATKGEAGMVGDPPVADREHLGEVRAAELREAAAVLGIKEVVFLGFLDRQLSDVPRERIVEKAVEEIRRTRPHVVIGFGPEGISHHPDHMVMAEVALEAFDAAADPGRFPEQLGNGLAVWEVQKLYQFEVPKDVFERWGIPFRGVSSEALTTFIDTSAYVETKIEAFSRHRTQVRDARSILSREGYREFAWRETYVLARSRLSVTAFPETDLFQGVLLVERPAP
jgi:LmbE family N-acetylglucosaminyl deacetylase